MLLGLVIALLVYVLIGVVVLLYNAKEDGMVLAYWWLIILAYPYLIAKNGFKL